MDSTHSITLILGQLEANDPGVREAAETALWERYLPLIRGWAREKLDPRVRPREDEDDVAQQTFDSFFKRHRGGQFTVDNRRALTALLRTMTYRKVFNTLAFHGAQCRDYRRDCRQSSADGDSSEAQSLLAGLEAPASPSDIEAAVREALEPLLASLSDVQWQLVLLKLEGCSAEEIAHKLGCPVRSVHRGLGAVKAVWDELVCRHED